MGYPAHGCPQWFVETIRQREISKTLQRLLIYRLISFYSFVWTANPQAKGRDSVRLSALLGAGDDYEVKRTIKARP